nr:MAG TPA: hypothetical protein [Caudoviricetes sp.]
MPHLSDKNKSYLSIVLRQIRAVNITIFYQNKSHSLGLCHPNFKQS